MNIIQIGSNRGGDDLTQIVFENRERLEKVILVEPMSGHHQLLKECYKGIPFIIEGIAITDDPLKKIMPLYYARGDAPHYEVASFSKDHLLKHAYNESDIIEETVGCMTINQLMDKHQFRNLDLLFIDAEGLDERIIRSIDFRKHKIEEIIYENLHIWNNTDLIHFLKTKNYNTLINWGKNGWSNKAVRQPFSFAYLVFISKITSINLLLKGKMICRKFIKRALLKLGLFNYLKSLKNSSKLNDSK